MTHILILDWNASILGNTLRSFGNHPLPPRHPVLQFVLHLQYSCLHACFVIQICFCLTQDSTEFNVCNIVDSATLRACGSSQSNLKRLSGLSLSRFLSLHPPQRLPIRCSLGIPPMLFVVHDLTSCMYLRSVLPTVDLNPAPLLTNVSCNLPLCAISIVFSITVGQTILTLRHEIYQCSFPKGVVRNQGNLKLVATVCPFR